MSDLSGRTTVVVGASRGLGRGIARAFAEAGAPVVAVGAEGIGQRRAAGREDGGVIEEQPQKRRR